jgi:hypothetical protein
MSITRREALTAAVGCGLTTTAAAGADDKPLAAKERPRPDPVYSNVPAAIRKVFEDTFPNYRCIRMAIRGEKDATVYRATVFNPASGGAHTQHVGGEIVTTPILYHLELDAAGKVLEETPRFVDTGRLPKAVTAAYEKWNPKGVKGQELWWQTEVPRGKDRVYRVRIIVNAIKAYSASFKEDGSVLTADPAEVPGN